MGIRLNRRPPDIYFKKKKTGGVGVNSVVPLTRVDEKMCLRVLAVRPLGRSDMPMLLGLF